MNVQVTGMGSQSILGKNLREQSERLFAPLPCTPPYQSSPQQLSLTPPDLKMIPLEKEFYEKTLETPLSRNSLLALASFEECITQAQWQLSELKNKRVAFILGTTAGCSSTDTEYAKNFVLDLSPDPQYFRESLKQNPAAILKRFSGLSHADIYIINNACTSSSDAIGLGASFIEHNKYDVVFAGGSDEILFQTFYGFSSLQLVSPQFQCRPFDKNRNGLLLTEAASVLCLERDKDFAKRSTAKAQGSIIGFASSTEAFHQTGPNPDAEGLLSITQEILKKSQVKVSDIDFVSAHATGTLNNDFSEGRFFTRHMPSTPILATKGYTGHCLGAVGALEVIYSFLSIQKKTLPISFGFSEVDPAIEIRPTQELTPLSPKKDYIAYSTSIGFGGVNTGLLLKGVV